MPPFGGHSRPVKRAKVFDDTDREATAAVAAESATTTYLSIKETHEVSSLAKASLMALARSFRSLYVERDTGELKEDVDLDMLRLLPPRYLEVLLQRVIATLPPDSTLNVSVLALFLSAETKSFDLSGALKASNALMTRLKGCKSLTRLDLSRQHELKDSHLAVALAELVNLEDVVLRGAIQIGDTSVIALSKACESRLRLLNLNFTATTKKGLVSLLARCSNLEVLKMASLNGLTDAAVQSIVNQATAAAIGWRHVPLSKLLKLKLRSCAVSDAGVGRLLSLTPLLETLDVSFTDLHTLDFIPIALADWRIRKLALSGLKLRTKSLEKLLSHIASLEDEKRSLLHTLKIGSQGLGRGASLISNAQSIVDLDSVALQRILPALESFDGLRVLSLHSNAALARRTAPLYELFANVAPRLEKLDLTGVPLKAKMLMGLFEETSSPALETLVLDNTSLNDEALTLLSTCKQLSSLHLAGTRITGTALAQLVEALPLLSVLDLSGCRGVPLEASASACRKRSLIRSQARRDFFTAVENAELDGSESG